MSTLVASENLLSRAESEGFRLRRLALLLGLTAQLTLALLVIRAFRLESRTLYEVALLATLGFLPHALLPVRWRLPAFALLSGAGVLVVLGVRDTAWVVGAAAALVAVCHLPVRWWVRVALVAGAGVALALARAGRVPVPWSAGAWAVLGSMLMFRLAVYLHAVRNDPVKPTPLQAAAYFLMLPNPVFPLFPVVDFSTFARSHYAEGSDETQTYQTGVQWIARGLVHLLLYRVIYQNLPPDPLHLESLGALAWYVVGTFLLYLRVSGQFHLIVGVLRLYGFALPETHKLYFLSSSFTDFWRRINIYWKDFMMKLVYYPSFFRLRRFGGTFALVASTAVVFFVTWLLHRYQWFWLLGSVPKSIPDALFWATLGALVVVTSVRESRRGRDRSLGARRWSGRLAARVVATFTALCILWSLWSAESVVEWLWMWRAAAHVDGAGLLLLAALLVGGVAVAGRNWSAARLEPVGPVAWWRRADVRTLATLALLLPLSLPEVAAAAGPLAPFLEDMRRTTLNAQDAVAERRGYYERLDRAPRLGAQGWEAQARRPLDWRTIPETPAYHPRPDARLYDLKPHARIIYNGAPLTTNEWGMRDAPRTLAKPPGTVRLAIIGPSFIIGTGVADDETLPAQLERRLNATVSPRTGLRYEALNFSAPGYSMLQGLMTFDEDVVRFAPDVAVLAVPAVLTDRTADHLVKVVANRRPVGYAGVDSLVRRWRLSPRLPWAELNGLTRIAAADVEAWVLRRFAEECRRRGIAPVLLVMDVVGPDQAPDAKLLRVAAEVGVPVIDALDVYGPADAHPRLQIAEWDRHPNAAGYALVTERVLRSLEGQPGLLAPPATPLSHSAERQP